MSSPASTAAVSSSSTTDGKWSPGPSPHSACPSSKWITTPSPAPNQSSGNGCRRSASSIPTAPTRPCSRAMRLSVSSGAAKRHCSGRRTTNTSTSCPRRERTCFSITWPFPQAPRTKASPRTSSTIASNRKSASASATSIPTQTPTLLRENSFSPSNWPIPRAIPKWKSASCHCAMSATTPKPSKPSSSESATWQK